MRRKNCIYIEQVPKTRRAEEGCEDHSAQSCPLYTIENTNHGRHRAILRKLTETNRRQTHSANKSTPNIQNGSDGPPEAHTHGLASCTGYSLAILHSPKRWTQMEKLLLAHCYASVFHVMLSSCLVVLLVLGLYLVPSISCLCYNSRLLSLILSMT